MKVKKLFKSLTTLAILGCMNFALAQRVIVSDHKGTKSITGTLVTESTTAPANPIEGDIWIDTNAGVTRVYSMASTTWLTVQQSTSIPFWKPNTNGGSYALNAIVNHDGVLFKNTTGTNTDATPDTDATNWEVNLEDTVNTAIPLWESATNGGSYITNDVINYTGVLYKNLTGINTDTTPDVDTTNWEVNDVDTFVTAVPLWQSNNDGGAYAINDIINHGGVLYKNLTGTNTDTTPDTDATNWERSNVDANRIGAKEYDSTQNYVLGQLISRSDGLYSNSTPITTPEAFDSTKWKKVATAINMAVLGIVDAAIAPPTSVSGDRYIVTNTATLEAGWGTIAGLENHDIVSYDGTNWSVALDVSVPVNTGSYQAYNEEDTTLYYFNGNQWTGFGSGDGEVALQTPYDDRVGTQVEVGEALYIVSEGVAYAYIAIQTIPSLDADYRLYGGNGDALGGITDALLPYNHARRIPYGETQGNVTTTTVYSLEHVSDSQGNVYAYVINSDSSPSNYRGLTLQAYTVNLIKFASTESMVFHKVYEYGTRAGTTNRVPYATNSSGGNIHISPDGNDLYLVLRTYPTNSGYDNEYTVEGTFYSFYADSATKNMNQLIFLKYDSDGNFEWQKLMGQSSPTTTSESGEIKLHGVQFSLESSQYFPYITASARRVYGTGGSTGSNYRYGSQFYYGGSVVDSNIQLGETGIAVVKVSPTSGDMLWKNYHEDSYYTSYSSSSGITGYYANINKTIGKVYAPVGDYIYAPVQVRKSNSATASNAGIFGSPSKTYGNYQIEWFKLRKSNGTYVNRTTFESINSTGSIVNTYLRSGPFTSSNSSGLEYGLYIAFHKILQSGASQLNQAITYDNPQLYDNSVGHRKIIFDNNGEVSDIVNIFDSKTTADSIVKEAAKDGVKYYLAILYGYDNGGLIARKGANELGETVYDTMQRHRTTSKYDNVLFAVQNDRIIWQKSLTYNQNSTSSFHTGTTSALYFTPNGNLRLVLPHYYASSESVFYDGTEILAAGGNERHLELTISTLSGNLINE